MQISIDEGCNLSEVREAHMITIMLPASSMLVRMRSRAVLGYGMAKPVLAPQIGPARGL